MPDTQIEDVVSDAVESVDLSNDSEKEFKNGKGDEKDE